VLFYSFIILNALSPVLYNVVFGFYIIKQKKDLKPLYVLFTLIFELSLLGSYLLLADALRRLYLNLKGNTDFVINKKLIFVYFASSIIYLVFLAVSFWLFVTSENHYYAKKALIGQLLSNFASYFMNFVIMVIFWKILVNMPKQ